MRIPPSFIFGAWCGLIRGAVLYVVRPSRAAKTSAARRLVRESCADQCADYGPGGPHHH